MAFKSFFSQVISESDSSLAQWKQIILDAVGRNGQVLIQLFPLLELIIGPQPDIVELPPQKSQNRFNRIFLNLVRIVSSADHPFVLFLDDMQWLDTASSSLLKFFLTDKLLTHFFFIGSYRDDEGETSKNLRALLEYLDKQQLNLKCDDIQPLGQIDVYALLNDTLGKEKVPGSFEELSELILEKTGGNPFFIKEFLMTLYQDSLIFFQDGWTWDTEKIRRKNLTENMIEMMGVQIRNLPEPTLDLLKIACCIGTSFKIGMLSDFVNESIQKCLERLATAFSMGLLYHMEDRINFAHDKVRETLYHLISQKEREELHCKIGRYLWNNADK